MNSFINKIRHSKVGHYAFVQILSKALTLISTYIIALHVSNTIFGYVTILQASLLVCITIFGLNLQNAFIRYYFERPLQDILQKLIPVYIGLFATTLLTSLIVTYYFLDHPYYSWFALLPIIGFGNSLTLVISLLARSNNQLGLYANSELVRPVLLSILSVILILYPQIEIVKYYVITLFVAMCITHIMCFTQKYKLTYTPNDASYFNNSQPFDTKLILVYVLPLFLVQIMSLINNISDRYILQFFVSMTEVGMYGKAYLIGSSFGLLFDSLMLLWAPYVMKNKHTSLTKHIPHIKKATYTILLLSLALLILSILLLYYNFTFLEVSNQIIILTIIISSAFIARMGYQIITPIFNAYDQTALVAKISLASMVLGIIFNFVLIPFIGILGAAIATYISFMSFSLLSLLFLRYLSAHDILNTKP